MQKLMAGALTTIVLLCAGCSREPADGGSAGPPAAAPVGPHGQALAALQNPPQAFAVSAHLRPSYRVGEELRFEVSSAENGELHIVQVDQDDAVTVLLPSAALGGNRIEANKPFVFPAPDSGIHIVAEGPAADSLVAFVVTREGQSLASIVPGLFDQATPTRGLSLQDGSGPPAPAQPATAAWSFARYTIRIEDARP